MIWYVGMFGTFAAATIAVYYKPDTRCAFSRGRVCSRFRADVLRVSQVSRHGHWSRPRNGWRLEARPLTTSQNLRTTGNPSISLAIHSLPTLRPNPKHTFVPPAIIGLYTQIQGTRTRNAISYAAMIQNATACVGRLERMLP